MNCDDVVCQAETDEQILTFDIPDHVLERTASSENAFASAGQKGMRAILL
jgi:hypothetical protein